MRGELSPEQAGSYRANGFLVIEGFLDDEEVQSLREAIDAGVAALGRDGRARSDDRRRRVDERHVNLWRTEERLRRFCLDPRLGRLAGELAGVDGVRLWHDQVLTKPAWGDPTGWHMDTPTLPFTHPGTCAFWFALVDTDLRNGCPYYLAGSHKLRMGTQGNSRLDGIRLLNPDWELEEPVPCCVRAGALVVHNGDIAHASSMNITPWPRPAYSTTWMPVGSTFNGARDGLPDEVPLGLRVGDPLDFDELFPVAHAR